ncbi:MAG: methyltransferase domain-containing protein [Kutzneria sp.]|nr:methyltransferase domain-containing protein [Kutzneria sp.]
MTPPFLALQRAAGTVAAYSTAVRLGLLDHIDRAPADPDAVAVACGASRRGVRATLATLEAAGLVERLDDGRYRTVVPRLAGMHPALSLWNRLADTVRSGLAATEADDPVAAARLSLHTAALPTPWDDVVRTVTERLPPARTVLDVGAGTAPWTIALAARDARCRVTALDLPPVLAVTRRAVAEAELSGQFDYLPGDLLNIRLPARHYDLIMVAQVCHLFDEATTESLLTRLSRALAPGGVLSVVDLSADSPGSAVHELSLLLRTRAGTLHRPEAYQHWLTAAGLTASDQVKLSADPELVLVVGGKPSGRSG